MSKFYELEDNSVDVLFLGSSHAFEDFNTGTLWDEFGMSAYNLAGSLQPMWNTYYYLKEALKTQTPKLVVLEAFGTTNTEEYMDDSRIIKNTYGLHWSLDKIQAIKISSPKERWPEFFWEYTQYHTRYTSLSREDFLKDKGDPLYYSDWKGFGCNWITTPLTSNDISNVTERSDLTEKTEKYYRSTIELAKENDISIIVVVSPYAQISANDQSIYNKAGDIANDLGVPFVNFNLLIDEIGIDYTTDAADGGHLNYHGNQKYSMYFGNYILERYEIPDHRGDEKYLSWDRQAAYLRYRLRDQELIELTDIGMLCEKSVNNDYWTIISVDGSCKTTDINLNPYLYALGIDNNTESGIWFNNAGYFWISGTNENSNYWRTPSHDILLTRYLDESGSYMNSILIDNVEYSKVKNGINVIVYDTKTDRIVISYGIDADKGYSLVK